MACTVRDSCTFDDGDPLCCSPEEVAEVPQFITGTSFRRVYNVFLSLWEHKLAAYEV